MPRVSMTVNGRTATGEIEGGRCSCSSCARRWG